MAANIVYIKYRLQLRSNNTKYYQIVNPFIY
jgi:hypothetical protein